MKNVDRVRRYIGELSQIAGIRHSELKSGRAKGTETFDVRTGGGLEYTVIKDRCLDIAWASYKDTSLSYITNNGMVAPHYFEPQGNGFLRNFYAGLLTTCGLSYIGTPCEDNGQSLGLHGRIANIPAEEVGYEVVESEEGIDFVIKGKVRETCFFGENLLLERTIRSRFGENKIYINDRVKNCGFTAQPLQILYHFNYGYPLLSETSEILLAAESVVSRTPRAEEGIDHHLRVEAPQPGFQEQVYYLNLKADEQGNTTVALLNERLGFGVYEKFNVKQLPNFIQWKQMGEGFYAMGLEVSNTFPDGRDKERSSGRLEFLAAGEQRHYDFELGILHNQQEMDLMRQIIAGYQ